MEALGEQGARVHAGDMTEIKDQGNPAERIALGEPQIGFQSKDGCLAEEALVVVLNGIGEAEHRHKAPVDLAKQLSVGLGIDDHRFSLGDDLVILVAGVAAALVLLVDHSDGRGVLYRCHRVSRLGSRSKRDG